MRKVKSRSERIRTAPVPDITNQPMVLMAARVSRQFHERAQAECVRREMSIQSLITSAVEAYISSPLHGDMTGQPPHIITLGTLDLYAEPRIRLWSTYLDKMPEDKIETMVSAMKWDLLMKKSARRKGGQKRVAAKS